MSQNSCLQIVGVFRFFSFFSGAAQCPFLQISGNSCLQFVGVFRFFSFFSGAAQYPVLQMYATRLDPDCRRVSVFLKLYKLRSQVCLGGVRNAFGSRL